jgi:hypothetical protein
MQFWATASAALLAMLAMSDVSQTMVIEPNARSTPPPPPMQHSEFFDTRTLGPKIQRLNQWILEGRGGFKESGDFRVSTGLSQVQHPLPNIFQFREGHYFWKEPLTAGSYRAMIHELTRTMVRMEKNQNFR